jgi:GT2 family glycosyltransferase
VAESGEGNRWSVGVVMLAYGPEPVIEEAIDAVLASRGVDVSLVVVDNGCERHDLSTLCDRPGVRLLRPARNLGFTGGVNLGAAEVAEPFLGLVNSDAVVAPDALSRLAAVAARPEVGIASGSIRLASDPTTMNSAGNPVHVLGLGWAGGLGDPATEHAAETDVAAASGAGLVLRRDVWEQLGGFPEEYFAYQEDLELSWRCWQSGLAVRFVPDAVVVHHYEFSRNDLKMYLLERNLLLFVLTCYGTRTLALLAPPLLAFELAMVGVAAAQGWGGRKVSGWWWLLTHARWVRDRRRTVQAARRVPDRDMIPLWTDRFEPAALPLPSWATPVQRVLAGWWRLVRRAV